ncbi:hypothetical protein CDL15_Pgr027325 [Punica granatum]|uniref:Protein TILLER ANGLE CONTROL 1 n=1 Tax=Punica granatum TaxID=22663 RepID=A0A218WCZ8_PUNGR|nr:hypothetical protein CDL15_Pgr027325 [Punica granatum]
MHIRTCVSLSGADDGLGRSGKKSDQSAAGGTVAKTLLEQVDGRLGSWKYGILTIGTFGYDPLITQQQQQGKGKDCVHGLNSYSSGGSSHEGIVDEGDGYEYPVVDNSNSIIIIAGGGDDHMNNIVKYGDDDEGEEEELNPLIIPEPRDSHVNEKKDHCRYNHHQHLQNVICKDAETISFRSSSSRINNNIPYLKRETKGERTTLADLFFAESAHATEEPKLWEAINSSLGKKKLKKKNDHDQLEDEEEEEDDEEDEEKENEEEEEASRGKKKAVKAHSFAKKFIPQYMSHGSRPIKKLHKLMRKMLKRKIHPELEQQLEVGGPGEVDGRSETIGARAMNKTLLPVPADEEDDNNHHGNQQPLMSDLLPNPHLIKLDGTADESVALLRTKGN